MYKKMIVCMLIISIFVFIVAISSLYVQIQIESGNTCGCAIPVWLFIPLLASLGLFIGSLLYYLLFPFYERGIRVDKNTILKFLSGDELRIFSILLDNNPIYQSEIVKKSKLSKVKVHRVLKRLERMGIIKKEKDRKLFVVRLSKDIKKLIDILD
ncbi:MAG TPA: MarR family transcriptional regulator [Candidatus Aenigmarchaeota archaeon]|nr:MarR family transcriptional regulator [Candidatus Aenigmarchaeota archaeon]